MKKIEDNKKMFLYEVDPLFFYDANNDGFGDFEGFINKMEYFDSLNVDGIIFPDIFNQENVILKNVNINIFDKYGKMDQLKKIIDDIRIKEKDFFIEINIQKILSTMIIKKTVEDYKSTNILKFISEENVNENEEVEWNTNRRIEAFDQIINFWTKIGVKNFIINDFEFLNDNNKKLNEKTIGQLKFFYKKIKEKNSDFNIGIRILFLDSNTINLIFKKYIGSFCDFVIDSSFSLIGTSKNFPFDIMEDFNQKDLFNKIKNIKIINKYQPRYFISLNNNKIGRVNSRWLTDENLINEANKSLLMLINLLPFSTINYYGDELGTNRLNLKEKNDYQDYEFVEKKRKIEFAKFKNNFEYSQKYLSRINSQSFFVWDDSNNGGFSINQRIFRKLPINYKTHNYKNEKDDKDSIFNSFIEIIKLSKSFLVNKNTKEYKFKLNSSKKKFVIKYRDKEKQIMILINLSKNTINTKINNDWHLIFSTYTNKKYNYKTNIILPYESLIFSKKRK